MRFATFAVLLLTSSGAAMAQDFTAHQIEAVEHLWDSMMECAEDEAACVSVAGAVRAVMSAGLCPNENRLEPCDAGSIDLPGDHVADTVPNEAPAAASAPMGIPPAPTGLTAGEPDWHAAIARDECLTETGFGVCQAYAPPRLSASGHLYEGLTVDETRLLTRWSIYSEECRGAVGQESISGWCAARDQAKDALAALGLCLYGDPVNGFRSCAPAGSTPETVPFDDAVMRSAFEALPRDQRQNIQNIISAGNADGSYGPRTAEALRRIARLVEDMTARDPRPDVFDLSDTGSAAQYLAFLQSPIAEVIIWGGH